MTKKLKPYLIIGKGRSGKSTLAHMITLVASDEAGGNDTIENAIRRGCMVIATNLTEDKISKSILKKVKLVEIKN